MKPTELFLQTRFEGGVISLTGLGDLVSTKKTRESIKQVRIVQRSRQYVIEVVHERAAQQAKLDPTLFASVDLGVSNLAALTSNAEHFTSRKLEKLTEKRHRRIKHYLHVASHRMIDVLIQHRISRGMYQASGKRLINADVNGSHSIARKVFPTAFDGPGRGAVAVRPRRLAV